MSDVQYPIGKFVLPASPDWSAITSWVDDIAQLPMHLQAAVAGLTVEQLQTPYRSGGWQVRQVVHHLADSHMNSFLRFKFALTEDAPVIKPYDEAAWAVTPDAIDADIHLSLQLLESLHARWFVLLLGMDETAFGRTFVHPQSGETTLAKALALYAWHGRHHVAHITSLRDRMGWT